jgi:hypothetical protein
MASYLTHLEAAVFHFSSRLPAVSLQKETNQINRLAAILLADKRLESNKETNLYQLKFKQY